MTVKHYVKLDLSKRDSRKAVALSRGDSGTHKIIFTLSNGSLPIELPADAVAAVTVRNGSGVVDSATVYPEDFTVEYAPSAKALSVLGNAVAILTVADSGGRTLYAPSFYLCVYEDYSVEITEELDKAITGSDAFAIIAATAKNAILAQTAAESAQTYAENTQEAVKKTLAEEFPKKQDALPENEGSSSHRMYALAPEGFKDADGNEIKYYLKRLNTCIAAKGIITESNRDAKLAEGLITKSEYENTISHDEPTDFSIVVRDANGRAVVEDGISPFHVVNLRQLEAAKKAAFASAVPYKVSKIPFASESDDTSGWYRIASTSTAGYSVSNLFKITAKVNPGGYWSDLIFTAAHCFDNAPEISVISHQIRDATRQKVVIDKLRVIYDTLATDTDGAAYNTTKTYLEIHIALKPTKYADGAATDISVSMLGNPTVNDWSREWELIEPTKTEELPTDFIAYEKSTVDTVWADVTATTDDLNSVGDRVPKTSVRYKVYGTDKNGAQTVYNVDATDTLSAQGYIVRRSTDGNILVPEKTGSNLRHAVSRGTLVSSLQELHGAMLTNITLIGNSKTRDVDLRMYIEAPDGSIETFVNNALSYSLAVPFNTEIGTVYIKAAVVPKRVLAYDVPVECYLMSYEFDSTSWAYVEGTLSSVVITLNSSLNDVTVRLIGDCTGYSADSDYITCEFDTIVNLYKDSVQESYDPSFTATLVANEEILSILPSTLSLRSELSELEAETLEMINGGETE